MSKGKVLAKVEGMEITEGDVNNFLRDLGPQMASQFQSEEGIKRLVEELVNQKLLYLDAKENKLDESDEFQELLKETNEKLLASFALTKLVSEIEVTEEGLKGYYNENIDNYKKPETAVASHILVESEEKAKEILKEINEGLEFAEAAEKYSTCPSKSVGGELGEFARGQMVPEFEDAAFKMEAGTISEPVKTQFGYHIIKLMEVKPEGVEEFEDIKPQLEEQYTRLKQQERYLSRIIALAKKYKVDFN